MTIGRGWSIEEPLAIPPRIHVDIRGEPLQRLVTAVGGVTTGVSPVKKAQTCNVMLSKSTHVRSGQLENRPKAE